MAKLNPSGTSLAYSTYLGGSGIDNATSITIDSTGAAYVAGRTDSFSFSAFPATARAGNPVQVSTDGGANWAASNAGLTSKLILALGARPGSPAAVLAGAGVGGDAFAAKLDAAG